MKHLVRTTPHNKLVFVGELSEGTVFTPVMAHTVCHLPGTLLLGYFNGMPISHLHLAEDLLETCYQTYMQQASYLAPERTLFNTDDKSKPDFSVTPSDASTKLRPDYIESLYYFYALTGKSKYQEMGWSIFKAIQEHAKVPNGFSSIADVRTAANATLLDLQDPVFVGETLKYFYLLFSYDRREINLEKFVFTSAGHPLPITEPETTVVRLT